MRRHLCLYRRLVRVCATRAHVLRGEFTGRQRGSGGAHRARQREPAGQRRCWHGHRFVHRHRERHGHHGERRQLFLRPGNQVARGRVQRVRRRKQQRSQLRRQHHAGGARGRRQWRERRPGLHFQSYTAETNNLSIIDTTSTPLHNGHPSLVFTESNSGTPDPSCTAGISIGDTHLTTFDGVHYDFQASGEFLLAEVANEFTVQARQLRARRSGRTRR